ncbi:apolipoprotein D-like [Pollicipes pollicipes]|uniref:apolipoprotein D-like n=1 Tax=Pollicipes pollicipes TaxID=41117 RepID=UPI0018853FE2|nr:apolipoprotein D-like [Pollicipes pollicipes]
MAMGPVWRLLLLVTCAYAQCRRFPAIREFDINSYLGRWYLQYKFSNEVSVPLSQCWSWSYYKDINSKLKVQTTYVNSLTNRVTNHQSRVWMKNPTEPSLLRYNLNYFLYNRNEDYQVIATDYANFTVEYQCSGTNVLNKRETVWLLTREQHPHPFTLERAFSALLQLGMDRVDLDREYQDCRPQNILNRFDGPTFLEWLVGRRTSRSDGPTFLEWLVGRRTSRSDGPTFLQWLTGGASDRIDRQMRGKSLSGFLAWMGL